MSNDARVAAARAVLTPVQWETWILHERGLSPRKVAAYRKVSRATVLECLDTCEVKIGEAMNGSDQDTAGADRGRA